jgi:hypothetical protein
MKSSSCDFPSKIPVDVYSNASCFTCFSSGSSSPEVAEFCPTLRLVYVIALAKASTCALSSVYGMPWNNFVQKVVPQVKKLILYVTPFKDLYVSRFFLEKKSLIFIPQAAHSPGPGHVLSRGITKVYSSTLKVLPYPFNLRIEPLTSCFILSDLDLHFFALKFRIK